MTFEEKDTTKTKKEKTSNKKGTKELTQKDSKKESMNFYSTPGLTHQRGRPDHAL